MMAISDSGRGMPQSKLDKLYEFGSYTEKSRVKMSSRLSTVYNIIQKHNGEIKVESEIGKGTKFTIILPVK